ncbi:ADP ribosylation factor family GTPase [Entamoeba marina]
MGGWLSKLFGKGEVAVIMVGLDNAGKTTILYQLKLGEAVTTIPTIGVNVETVRVKNVTFSVMDLGGQSKIRPLWRHYYEGCRGVVFVVDASDKERIQESCTALHKLCSNDLLKDCNILVFGNKNDVDGSLSKDEFTKAMKLDSLNRTVHVQMICAVNNDGIKEGFTWLSDNIA